MTLDRREFFKRLGVIIGGASLPRSVLFGSDPYVRDRGENTDEKIYNSWSELTNELWKNHPGLLRNLQSFWNSTQKQIQLSPWLQKYNEIRKKLPSDTVFGVIISPDSYAGEKSYEKRMRESFEIPFQNLLRAARKYKLLGPDTLVMSYYTVDDHLFRKPEDPTEDASIKHAAKNNGKNGDAYPYTNIGGDESGQVFWPPDIDWIFVDGRPFVYGVYKNNSQQEILSGLIHEQMHLLGPADLYRYWIDRTAFYVNQNGEREEVFSLLQGWSEYKVFTATLAIGDIMHSLTPDPELSALSALQIAVARAQRIFCTMHEGIPDFSVKSDSLYRISILGTNVQIEGELVSFGPLVRPVDNDKFGSEAYDGIRDARLRGKLIPPEGTQDDINNTYMIGVTIRDGAQKFTLPVPSIFNLLGRFRNPLSDHRVTPLNLEIDAHKLFSALASMKSEDRDYTIDIRIVLANKIESLDKPNEHQHVLATAPIFTNPILFQRLNHPEFSMVWVALPLTSRP